MKKIPVLICLTLMLGRSADAGPPFDSLPDQTQTLIQTLVRDHFSDSTLSKDAQTEELAWFAHAATDLKGTEISVLSEQLPTHDYEAQVLAPAFSKLTEIRVTHDRKPEGDVIRQINLKRIMAAKGRHDALVNDSDMIGTHARSDWALALSDYMAGAGDRGIPNGLPVDEWGIRMEGCHPVGSSVSRGGATNSPAAVYALAKYIDWLQRFAPPEAREMTFSEAGAVPAKGQVAQQIFWYTAFTSEMTKKGLPVVNEDGTPKWRMAPSPHGAYWQDGMKLGYQDVGAWTIPRAMGANRQKAAWLYAQFTVSRTVSLQKTLHGLTPIRLSDLQSPQMQQRAPALGGLVEFYRSPARQAWSPTGVNVPDYPRLAKLWWPNIADAVTGAVSPQQALDNLAAAQDRALSVIERNFLAGDCGPKMVDEDQLKGSDWWLTQPGAPKSRLNNEKPRGETIRYEDLLRRWEVAGN